MPAISSIPQVAKWALGANESSQVENCRCWQSAVGQEFRTIVRPEVIQAGSHISVALPPSFTV